MIKNKSSVKTVNENKNIEELYERLVEFNSTKILTKLGEDYECGNNVKQDFNKALKCYLKIARMENSKVAYFKIVDFCRKYENIYQTRELNVALFFIL